MINDKCLGCNVLDCVKQAYAVLDYKEAEPSDVLFLSDSLKYDYNTYQVIPFTDKEKALILNAVSRFEGLTFEMLASIKCPDVRDEDITTESKKLCRQHLRDTIAVVKPKLIFTCGNLALKMLLNKSGIEDKHGSYFPYEQDGVIYPVVPIMHPFAVIREPRLKTPFFRDVMNGVNKYIYNIRNVDFNYTFITCKEDLAPFEHFRTTTKTLACDTETEGLDFKTDRVHSASLSDGKLTCVFAVDHKESPLSPEDRKYVIDFWRDCMQNTKNRKVFVNAKFDLKMMFRYNIKTVNIWDAKTMFHLIDEESKKRLSDLTKIFIPETMEDL